MEKLTLLSVFVPGLIAAAMILAGIVLPRTFNRCGKRMRAEQIVVHSFGALGVGIGFLVCFQLQEGLPDLPPVQRWHWLAIIAAGAMAVGMLHGVLAGHWVGTVGSGVLLAAVAGFALQPLPAYEQPWLWKGALAVIVCVLWLAMNPLVRRRRGHIVPLVIMLSFTAASVVLIAGVNSAKFGVLAGSLACMAGVLMVIGLVMRTSPINGGALAVMLVMLPAWMMTGMFYDSTSDVPRTTFLLIGLSPLAMWLGELLLVARSGRWKAWLVRVGAVAILLGAAVILMFLNAPPPLEPYEY